MGNYFIENFFQEFPRPIQCSLESSGVHRKDEGTNMLDLITKSDIILQLLTKTSHK